MRWKRVATAGNAKFMRLEQELATTAELADSVLMREQLTRKASQQGNVV